MNHIVERAVFRKACFCGMVATAASLGGPHQAFAEETRPSTSTKRAEVAAFYVDPDYAGGPLEGSAARPWNRLGKAEWSVVDDALAGGDVVVHFSARETDADTNEVNTREQGIYRNDASAHRVTLDGMSRYNTDDANPVWLDYSGTRCHEIRAGYPMSTGPAKRNCVTIRGFKIVAGVGDRGGQIINYWGGDHVVIEHNDLSHADTARHGAGLQFGYAHHKGRSGNGGCTNIIIRNNVIHDTFGEGIYLGGSEDTGLPAHNGILVENNHVYNTGRWGGEGDGIDPKDGITDLVIRGNHIHHGWGDANVNGIPSSSPMIAEGNTIHDMPEKGISLGTYWGRGYSGSIVRNNLLYRNGADGIYVGTEDRTVHGTQVLNNTVYGNGGAGLVAGNGGALTGLVVRNNIFVKNRSGLTGWGDASAFTVTHNVSYGNTTDYGASFRDFGGRLHNRSENPLFENAAAADFRLRRDSPCVDAGVAVDAKQDALGTARPRGDGWDLGAYERVLAD